MHCAKRNHHIRCKAKTQCFVSSPLLYSLSAYGSEDGGGGYVKSLKDLLASLC